MSLNHSSKCAELTSEQAEFMGRFVNECSNIDFLLGEVLGRLLFTPTFLMRVYADEMTASAKQSAISKAVEIQRIRYSCSVIPYDVLERIDQLNAAIGPIRGMRNRFAHFCWARGSDDEIFGSSFAGLLPNDKRQARDFRTITNDEIKHAHQTAWNIVKELEELLRILPEFSEEEALQAKRV